MSVTGNDRDVLDFGYVPHRCRKPHASRPTHYMISSYLPAAILMLDKQTDEPVREPLPDSINLDWLNHHIAFMEFIPADSPEAQKNQLPHHHGHLIKINDVYISPDLLLAGDVATALQ